MATVLIPASDPMMPFTANSTVHAINPGPGRMNAPPALPCRGVINDALADACTGFDDVIHDARVNSRTGFDDVIHGDRVNSRTGSDDAIHGE